jgi:hypothetical protein
MRPLLTQRERILTPSPAMSEPRALLVHEAGWDGEVTVQPEDRKR